MKRRFSRAFTGAATVLALATGCAPAAKMPPVSTPLNSEEWKTCADELSNRESASLIDDMSLDGKTLLCRGVVAAASGRTDEGLEMLTEASVRDKDDYRPHYLSGRILTGAGRFEEALSAYERSAKKNPQMEVPTEELGRTIMKKSGDAEALSFLTRADERSLCPYSCQGLLARLCYKAGDEEKAMKIYKSMLIDNPGDPNPHAGIAAIRNAQGDFEGESESLTRAVESGGFAGLTPAEKAAIHYSHAFARYNARKYKGALKSIERALAIETRAEWFLLAGWISLKLDDPAVAATQFDKAIELDDKLAPAYAGRGDTFIQLRRNKDAVAAFKKASQLDKTSALFKLKLAHAQALNGDLDSARLTRDEALEQGGTNLPADLVKKVEKLVGPTTNDEEGSDTDAETDADD